MSSEKGGSSPVATINGHVLIVVMGVSGSGKSTLGAALAKALGCPFVDADDLHPQTNVDKMSRGEPLTDADRAPWLVDVRRTALKVAENDSQDDSAGVVVACSTLKVRYREVLRGERSELDLSDHPPPPSKWRTLFVHPDVPREILLERMMRRNSHFMKANMLTSQLEALEDPSGTGERDVVRIGVVESMEEQVQTALEGLTGAGACQWCSTGKGNDVPSAVWG